jgi:hypothetical protein
LNGRSSREQSRSPQGVQEPDYRHRWLLRTRRERPRRRCTAGKRDELAPFQLIESHSVPASQGRIASYPN